MRAFTYGCNVTMKQFNECPVTFKSRDKLLNIKSNVSCS